jgi:hypothetical protein
VSVWKNGTAYHGERHWHSTNPLAVSWRAELRENMPTYFKRVGLLLFVVPLFFFSMWSWWQHFARKRLLASIKTMAEKERSEIGGQPVEHWLNILNQDRTEPIVAGDTMVLTYKGQDYFFVDAGITYVIPSNRAICKIMKAFILVAIGQSAVRLLSEQDRVFRRICGSAELAAFSVYRWSDFAKMLAREKERQIPAA